MRDFLYSEVANFYSIPNIPEDPDLTIEVGKHLCEELLEPLQSTFGRFFNHLAKVARLPLTKPPLTWQIIGRSIATETPEPLCCTKLHEFLPFPTDCILQSTLLRKLLHQHC
jgi:hypothetical protein